jgi:hypothetical protein
MAMLLLGTPVMLAMALGVAALGLLVNAIRLYREKRLGCVEPGVEAERCVLAERGVL